MLGLWCLNLFLVLRMLPAFHEVHRALVSRTTSPQSLASSTFFSCFCCFSFPGHKSLETESALM